MLNKSAIESAIHSPTLARKFTKEIENMKEVFEPSNQFWRILQSLLDILKPISNLINFVESDDNFVGTVFDKIDQCFDQLDAVVSSSLMNREFLDFVKEVSFC